jgi:serine/threonine protein kinase
MLRRDGYIKILDFGLAKLSERQAAPDINLTNKGFETEPGTVMGTAHYMSPEQARGLEVDARTDVFSLGIVIYEMLAGKPPFGGATASDVMTAILKEEPVPIAHHSPLVPAEIEWMVKKALAKDREERYQTIRDFYIDLKRVRQELELQAKLDGLSPAVLRQGPKVTTDAGQPADPVNGAPALVETLSTGSTNRKRRIVPGVRSVIVAVVAITALSLSLSTQV